MCSFFLTLHSRLLNAMCVCTKNGDRMRCETSWRRWCGVCAKETNRYNNVKINRRNENQPNRGTTTMMTTTTMIHNDLICCKIFPTLWMFLFQVLISTFLWHQTLSQSLCDLTKRKRKKHDKNSRFRCFFSQLGNAHTQCASVIIENH